MVYQRIRALKEERDFTQKYAGEKINVPQRTYAYYESGQKVIPPWVLSALASFYDTSVDYLLNKIDVKEAYLKGTDQRREG